jgi:hypothetical protein
VLLAGSTNKKVIVARFDREELSGFVNPLTYLSTEGLELLTTVGTIVIVPFSEVKTVSFVRDFDQGESRRELRQFTTRPKMEGLWVRLRFRDDDSMDGLLPNNLLQLEPYGFTMVPPDPGFHNQRVFVPKAALKEVQVLGVVGSPLRKGRKAKPVPAEQLPMFDKG